MIEFARLGVLYFHLICCCIALGLILVSDFELVKCLYKDARAEECQDNHLEKLQTTIVWVLGGLWLSGIALCYLDTLLKGWEIFNNPKLQVKIFLVTLLTINGVVLHRLISPMFIKYDNLHKFTKIDRRKAAFIGAVSGVTWLYAAFIGIARPLAWKFSFLELIWPYPIIVLVGFLTMLFVIEHSRST